MVISESLNAIQLIACNPYVQYNKIVLVDKSTFCETVKGLV